MLFSAPSAHDGERLETSKEREAFRLAREVRAATASHPHDDLADLLV